MTRPTNLVPGPSVAILLLGVVTLTGCPKDEPEPEPEVDQDWFDFLCDEEECTPPDGWEPTDDLHEAFVLAEAEVSEDLPVYFVAITFHAHVAVAPDDLDTTGFHWTYHFWAGEIFGGTEIMLDVTGHEATAEEDLDLYDVYILTEEEILQAVTWSFTDVFEDFADSPDAFALAEGQLKDHIYRGNFGDPVYTLYGNQEGLIVDAGTGEIREDP